MHRRTRRLGAALASLCLIGSACGGEGNLRPPTLVDRLRILGVQAEPPEIPPLEDATLRVLAVDPEGRELGFVFVACDPIFDPDPGAPTFTACESAANLEDPEAARALFESGDARLLGLDLASPEAVYTPPRDAEGRPIDLMAELPAGDPRRRTGGSITVVVLAAPLEELEAALLDPKAADLSSTETALALKRITLSEQPRPNENPALRGLRSGGALLTPRSALSFPPGVDVTLRAEVTPESLEHYERLRPDGTNEKRQETITVSWYSSAGRFGDRRTQAGEPNLFRAPGPEGPPPPPAGGRIELWMVARDGRGGTDWMAFEGIVP
ncbi:MAG: hypothetical protein D6729_04665 [Deltaproteobacteria bacterium]|nr:MAG: hypothetical protein D6729_04665 [Deltaproteobacteria bacterium]